MSCSREGVPMFVHVPRPSLVPGTQQALCSGGLEEHSLIQSSAVLLVVLSFFGEELSLRLYFSVVSFLLDLPSSSFPSLKKGMGHQ